MGSRKEWECLPFCTYQKKSHIGTPILGRRDGLASLGGPQAPSICYPTSSSLSHPAPYGRSVGAMAGCGLLAQPGPRTSSCTGSVPAHHWHLKKRRPPMACPALSPQHPFRKVHSALSTLTRGAASTGIPPACVPSETPRASGSRTAPFPAAVAAGGANDLPSHDANSLGVGAAGHETVYRHVLPVTRHPLVIAGCRPCSLSLGPRALWGRS